MFGKIAALLEFVFAQQSTTIGGGIIVFVQSYSFQTKFKNVFNNKQVFWESQGKDDVFNEYCKAIKSGACAVLICVIGGKLSEGINFADDLARTVIVFGLPYPSS